MSLTLWTVVLGDLGQTVPHILSSPLHSVDNARCNCTDLLYVLGFLGTKQKQKEKGGGYVNLKKNNLQAYSFVLEWESR